MGRTYMSGQSVVLKSTPQTPNGTPGAIATGDNQFWGWAYQILPYFEQQSLWEMDDEAAIAATALPGYFCPSRRKPIAFEVGTTQVTNLYGGARRRGQIDYGANRGEHVNGPGAWKRQAVEGPTFNGIVRIPRVTLTNGAVTFTAGSSTVTASSVLDGTSNTLLVTEKSVPLQGYEKGWGPEGDCFQGGFVTGVRTSEPYQSTIGWYTGYQTPVRDARAPESGEPGYFAVGIMLYQAAGSAHPAGMNAALCDGSVRVIRYGISPDVFRAVMNRKEGTAFGSSAL
jgi:hypothetical protein